MSHENNLCYVRDGRTDGTNVRTDSGDTICSPPPPAPIENCGANNYSRWLPVCLADIQSLHSPQPPIEQESFSGNSAVSRSKDSFAKVWTDMELEQSIYLY